MNRVSRPILQQRFLGLLDSDHLFARDLTGEIHQLLNGEKRTAALNQRINPSLNLGPSRHVDCRQTLTVISSQ